MTNQQHPESTAPVDHDQSSPDLRIPPELLFRFHFLPFAVLAPFVLLSPIGEYLPLMILATEFGPWAHPLNFIFSLLILVAIPVLDIMKRRVKTDDFTLRQLQIILWWTYWGMILLALICGTYRGP